MIINYKNFKAAALIVSVLLSSEVCVTAKSWPLFMGNTQRNGFTYEQAGGTLTYKWSYPTYADSIASPVVKGSRVFAVNRAGSIYCFDSRTGDVNWQYSVAGWIDSTPAVEDSHVYVMSRDGVLYSFSESSGNLEWSLETGGANLASPLAYSGNIYISRGTPYKDIKCISSATRSETHSFETIQPIWSSPLQYGGYIYTASNDGYLYKLTTGLELQWKYSTGAGIFRLSTPAAYDGYLYFAPGDAIRKVYCLDSYSTLIWESPELNTGGAGVFTSCAASSEDNVYVVMSSTVQVLYCLEKINGNLVWKSELGDSVEGDSYISSPAVTYDTVYAGSETGYLTALSTAGAESGRYLVHESSQPLTGSPAVSNGMVYVVTKEGIIYAYEVSRAASMSYPDSGQVVEDAVFDVTGTVYSPDFQRYTLYIATGTGDVQSSWVQVSSSAAEVKDDVLSSVDMSLLNDGEYSVILLAQSAAADGLAVNTFELDTPPAPPTGAAATAKPLGTIELSWNISPDDAAGDNDVAGYRIFRRSGTADFDYSAPIVSLSAGSVLFTDSDVQTGIVYDYVLRSFDARNESSSSAVVSTATYTNTVTIDSGSGGTVQLSDGTGVYFPPGALKQDSQVAVTKLKPGQIPAGTKSHEGGWLPLDLAWEFEVQPALEFNKNVTLNLVYAGYARNDLDENSLRVYWYDESAGLWRMVDSSVPFEEQDMVSAYVPHFTKFRLAYYLAPDNVISKNSFYVWPNPARGSEVNFKFMLLRAADIEIRIFNVAGEIIEEFSGSYAEDQAGKSQEITWDISGMASGVYICYIEGEAAGRKDTVIKKFAIIK